jgi:hypothetical protein
MSIDMEAKKFNPASWAALGVVILAAIGLVAQVISSSVATAQTLPDGQMSSNNQTQSKQPPGNATNSTTAGPVKPMPQK